MTATASKSLLAAELGGLKAEYEVAWAGLSDCVLGLGNEELARHLRRVHVSSERYYGAIARVMHAYVQHRDTTTDDDTHNQSEVSRDAT